MNEENKSLEEQLDEQIMKEPPAVFEPAPRWKRVGAWILLVIMIIAIINWLVSIAYPDWPQYVMELFR